MPKVTVIMPSLNVANYIQACIESVLAQKFKDIEVLAIDAGSTDGTVEFLEEYARKDKRVHIVHSDKKSYGYQVNLGIELAKGEYIGIVETDDVIAKDMYQTLYQVASADNLDYVKCGFSSFVEAGQGLRWYQKGGRCIADKSLSGKVICPANMPELAIQDYYLWAGIYQKNLLKDIRLSETPGAAFQDIGFIYQVISSAQNAVYLDDELYFYRQTGENSSFHRNGFQYLADEYRLLERILSQKPNIWKQAYYERMFRQIIGRFQRMAAGGRYRESADMDVLRENMRQAEQSGIFKTDKLSIDNQILYNKLQKNPAGVFEEFYGNLQPKMERLKDLLNFIGDNEAVIFSCGKYGRFVHLLLECYKKGQVKAYCDNNDALWNDTMQGVKVLRPEQAVKEYKSALYVIANLKNGNEIKNQLAEAAVSEDRIYVYQPDFEIELFFMHM